MAKITGPLFSMLATGSFGNIVFDRRGYAYLKPNRRDAKSPAQGDFRQAITVAQKCAAVCGTVTRQQLRAMAADPAHWSAYLTKQLVGPQRKTLLAALAQYDDPAVNQAAWEEAAASIGLREVHVPYANEASVSPGTQLFALASILFSLGLYKSLGQPNGNAAIWRDSIIS